MGYVKKGLNVMKLFKTVLVILFLSQFYSVSYSAGHKVISTSDIQWGLLNPLRGEKSPRAADLWGDRTKGVATGMLVKFNKGFSSPPHIHNITYRGVVIKGLMHNDDPDAATTWMPSGSFWTQPAGEEHVTAANGEENLIYLEIDSGPYLVKPSKEAFDNGERPINIDQGNLVWLSESDSSWVNGGDAQISHLWGDTAGKNGTFVKLPSELAVALIIGLVLAGLITTLIPANLLEGSSSSGLVEFSIATLCPLSFYLLPM